MIASSFVNGPASVAAWLVAGVLIVATATKAWDSRRTAREFRALGVPMPDLAARLVPPAELFTAAVVLIVPRWGGVVAALVFATFTAVLWPVVRSGREVSCGCFGTASQPVTTGTLVRNGVLIALALTAALTPSVQRPDVASVLVVGSAIVLAALGSQLWSLEQTLGRLWSVELAGELVTSRTTSPLSAQMRPAPVPVAAPVRRSNERPPSSREGAMHR
ncbi:MAG: MauE/DoxX family redox-associated membrane protein [Actinomycetota bacterium]